MLSPASYGKDPQPRRYCRGRVNKSENKRLTRQRLTPTMVGREAFGSTNPPLHASRKGGPQDPDNTGPEIHTRSTKARGDDPFPPCPLALSFAGLSRNNERDRVEIRGLTSSRRNADGLRRPFGFLARRRRRRRGTRTRRCHLPCIGAAVDECKQIFYGLLTSI